MFVVKLGDEVYELHGWTPPPGKGVSVTEPKPSDFAATEQASSTKLQRNAPRPQGSKPNQGKRGPDRV